MKKSFYWGLVLAVGLPVVFGSCKKDDDPAPVEPIVGTWKLDIYSLTDAPATFSYWNGYLFPNSAQPGLYGEDALTLTIKSDKTYTRLFSVLGPDKTEGGTWALDGKAFTIKSTDSDFGEEDFTLETDLTATSPSMVLSSTRNLTLLPNAIFDRYKDSTTGIPSDTVKKYQQDVDVTVVFSYDKVTTP